MLQQDKQDYSIIFTSSNMHEVTGALWRRAFVTWQNKVNKLKGEDKAFAQGTLDHLQALYGVFMDGLKESKQGIYINGDILETVAEGNGNTVYTSGDRIKRFEAVLDTLSDEQKAAVSEKWAELIGFVNMAYQGINFTHPTHIELPDTGEKNINARVKEWQDEGYTPEEIGEHIARHAALKGFEAYDDVNTMVKTMVETGASAADVQAALESWNLQITLTFHPTSVRTNRSERRARRIVDLMSDVRERLEQTEIPIININPDRPVQEQMDEAWAKAKQEQIAEMEYALRDKSESAPENGKTSTYRTKQHAMIEAFDLLLEDYLNTPFVPDRRKTPEDEVDEIVFNAGHAFHAVKKTIGDVRNTLREIAAAKRDDEQAQAAFLDLAQNVPSMLDLKGWQGVDADGNPFIGELQMQYMMWAQQYHMARVIRNDLREVYDGLEEGHPAKAQLSVLIGQLTEVHELYGYRVAKYRQVIEYKDDEGKTQRRGGLEDIVNLDDFQKAEYTRTVTYGTDPDMEARIKRLVKNIEPKYDDLVAKEKNGQIVTTEYVKDVLKSINENWPAGKQSDLQERFQDTAQAFNSFGLEMASPQMRQNAGVYKEIFALTLSYLASTSPSIEDVVFYKERHDFYNDLLKASDSKDDAVRVPAITQLIQEFKGNEAALKEAMFAAVDAYSKKDGANKSKVKVYENELRRLELACSSEGRRFIRELIFAESEGASTSMIGLAFLRAFEDPNHRGTIGLTNLLEDLPVVRGGEQDVTHIYEALFSNVEFIKHVALQIARGHPVQMMLAGSDLGKTAGQTSIDAADAGAQAFYEVCAKFGIPGIVFNGNSMLDISRQGSGDTAEILTTPPRAHLQYNTKNAEKLLALVPDELQQDFIVNWEKLISQNVGHTTLQGSREYMGRMTNAAFNHTLDSVWGQGVMQHFIARRAEKILEERVDLRSSANRDELVTEVLGKLPLPTEFKDRMHHNLVKMIEQVQARYSPEEALQKPLMARITENVMDRASNYHLDELFTPLTDPKNPDEDLQRFVMEALPWNPIGDMGTGSRPAKRDTGFKPRAIPLSMVWQISGAGSYNWLGFSKLSEAYKDFAGPGEALVMDLQGPKVASAYDAYIKYEDGVRPLDEILRSHPELAQDRAFHKAYDVAKQLSESEPKQEMPLQNILQSLPENQRDKFLEAYKQVGQSTDEQSFRGLNSEAKPENNHVFLNVLYNNSNSFHRAVDKAVQGILMANRHALDTYFKNFEQNGSLTDEAVKRLNDPNTTPQMRDEIIKEERKKREDIVKKYSGWYREEFNEAALNCAEAITGMNFHQPTKQAELNDMPKYTKLVAQYGEGSEEVKDYEVSLRVRSAVQAIKAVRPELFHTEIDLKTRMAEPLHLLLSQVMGETQKTRDAISGNPNFKGDVGAEMGRQEPVLIRMMRNALAGLFEAVQVNPSMAQSRSIEVVKGFFTKEGERKENRDKGLVQAATLQQSLPNTLVAAA